MEGIRRIGLRNYLRFRAHRLRDKLRPRDELLTLRSNEARYPLQARGGTSDLSVFAGVFVRRSYACLAPSPRRGLIVDCGANVGYSAAFLLTRFPNCRLIAVEPDPSNFEMLARNLAPYGDAARLVHAAVWSHPTTLQMQSSPYRDGRHWSRQVKVCAPQSVQAIAGVDLGVLLATSGFDRISILKMDIEGAEAVVFANNYQGWLAKVDELAIELHDDSSFGNSTAILSQAVDARAFTRGGRGEITHYRRVA